MKTIRKTLEVQDKFSSALEKFAQQAAKVDGQAKGFSQSSAIMATGIGSVVDMADKASAKIINFVTSVVKGGAELAESAAQADGVAKAYGKLTTKLGVDSEELTKSLSRATGGMLDTMTMQQQAMKALVSGIDPKQLTVAMEYVATYAQATGGNINDMMQTVMTGLARGSAAFLDDVGIQVMGSSDVVGDAIAQMQEKMGEFSGGTDQRIMQNKATFEDLKRTIGDTLLPAYEAWLGVQEELAESGDDIAKVFTDVVVPVMKVTLDIAKGIVGAMGDMAKWINEFKDPISEDFAERSSQAFAGTAEEAKLLAAQLLSLRSMVDGMGAPAQQASARFYELKSRIEEASAGTVEWAGGLQQFNIIAKDGTITTLEALNKAVEENARAQELAANAAATAAKKEADEKKKAAAESAEANADAAKKRAESERDAYLQAWAQRQTDQANMQEHLRRIDEINAGHRQKERDAKRKERDEEAEARREDMERIRDEIESSSRSAADSILAIGAARVARSRTQAEAEKKAILESTMSEKAKEAEIKKIDDAQFAREQRMARIRLAAVAVESAANVVLAIQKAHLGALDMIEKSKAPLVSIRLAQGAAILAAGLAGAASVAGAAASIPKREHGGVTTAGGQYEIMENGKPEIYQDSTGRWLMEPTNGGRITPINTTMGGSTYNISVVVNGASATAELTGQAVYDAVVRADREGVDWRRASNLMTARG